jgi:hypothetical protein
MSARERLGSTSMHAVRLHVTLAVLTVLGALAACTSQKEALIARGFDPAYAEGYDDGCSSGQAAAGSTFDSGDIGTLLLVIDCISMVLK